MTGRKLSVALPVRNGANYLAAALDSILSQRHAEFDLFVSDNASDDATPEILAQYANRDPRVRVSRSEELISQVANMNRAVALTDTPWVKLFCHDDLMREDCLEKLHQLILEVDASRVAIIGNGERHLFANGYFQPEQPVLPTVTLPGREVIQRRFSSNAGSVPLPAVTNATLQKAAFEAQGGFDERYVHFDLFCWYEMLTRWDYAFIHESLTTNRIHGRQVAVGARVTLRTVDDYRKFMPEFVARHGKDLRLGFAARMRARLIPVSVAATTLAIEFIAGRWQQAFRLLLRMPVHWLLPIIPLALRGYIAETRRTRTYAGKVPLELVYP